MGRGELAEAGDRVLPGVLDLHATPPAGILPGQPLDDADPWREARHGLRGAYHGLRLCLMVLEGENDPSEMLTYLGHLEDAADACDRYATQLNELPNLPR